MTKQEAKEALKNGKKIYHSYYLDNEFLYLDSNNNLKDENEINLGTLNDEFWVKRQNWINGWYIEQ